MRILLIEDDLEAAATMVRGLKELGHSVEHAATGTDGLALAQRGGHDVWIVDRMLPGMDGLAVIGALRAKGVRIPALVLSALGKVDDRVEGLKAGGDDYLVKPYAFAELVARIEALGRRLGTEAAQETKLKAEDLEMDLLTRTVTRGGKDLDLQPREFRLLEYLMRNAGQVVTRTMLLENVWEYHFDPQTNLIDVHISRLRQKVDKDFKVSLIQTVRGSGYMLRASV